jgi:hypothetical protein
VKRTGSLKVALTAVSLLACGSERSDFSAGGLTGRAEQAFINGEDDRLEYFELSDSKDRSLMEESIVALVSDATARQLSRGNVAGVPTWGELNDLCPGEPFLDQPSAAFCSGVLVDWDLVLTSGHCVDVLPLSNLRVLFNYYFEQPGELALTRDDVYRVREVVLAKDDKSRAGERLDFGWLRLDGPVRPPHFPATVRTRAPEVELGDAIVAINAGGGVPFKLDAGGHVRDLRTGSDDYFVADTDTSEGSSGGPAFNSERLLVGTLARGAPDFIDSLGCLTTDHEQDPRFAREQFTYAYRSVAALCEVDPGRWLCDSSCQTECEPPPPPAPAPSGSDGCALQPGHGPSGAVGPLTCAAVVLAAALRRRGALRVKTRAA